MDAAAWFALQFYRANQMMLPSCTTLPALLPTPERAPVTQHVPVAPPLPPASMCSLDGNRLTINRPLSDISKTGFYVVFVRDADEEEEWISLVRCNAFKYRTEFLLIPSIMSVRHRFQVMVKCCRSQGKQGDHDQWLVKGESISETSPFSAMANKSSLPFILLSTYKGQVKRLSVDVAFEENSTRLAGCVTWKYFAAVSKDDVNNNNNDDSLVNYNSDSDKFYSDQWPAGSGDVPTTSGSADEIFGCVDAWQITVLNQTMSICDNWSDQWIFQFKNQPTPVTQFKIPLWFRPGHRYEVTVRGLHLRPAQAYDVVSRDNYYVVISGFVEFRAGESLSMEDVVRLRDRAAEQALGKSAPCVWFYRNKPREYFDDIFNNQNGIMTAYLKDAGGDPRGPINGEITGLYFNVNVSPGSKNGEPIRTSPFGNTRFLIDAEFLLRRVHNVYFADFFCARPSGPHYVTLVMTRTDTDADDFCRRRLPRLSLDWPIGNPFLFRTVDGLRVTAVSGVQVEVLLAYDVNLADLLECGGKSLCSIVPCMGFGKSRPGGIAKPAKCPACDLFGDRPMAAKPPGVVSF